ncbi:photosynthetic reaction center cytochrome PufC [Acuticoccus kandeliae]|uniref:photosynthetic reaction center cytochrome PufC n=1 Tax=Acuticoccus kandeliae TaxID=2073160 RepID=UPI000D3E1B25|nr:photosynthetic reaction center cytochrome PufC [Acuticoccus kandeliae]
MKSGLRISFLSVVVVLIGAAMLLMPDYSRPPIESRQIGYRGTGMIDVANPREEAALLAANVVTPPTMPLITAGPKASEAYENVQVLGDLSQAQFTRLMLAITAWVAPEQGCTYCHSAAGFADDSLYTKRVSRWMIEMTRHINNQWTDHVKTTGVTCNTCHRGKNVPEFAWYEPEITGVQPGSNAMLGYYKELYGASEVAGDTSLGLTPLMRYLDSDTQIRVVSDTALPTGNAASTKQTEQTYALMMHMSQSLGVNCTFCHNTRAFTDWAQSPPQRATAWYGIRLARDLNENYLGPITEVFPPHRLGPHGDVGKVACGTCHQGLSKPLNGVSMLPDYPSLAAANTTTPEELLPRTLEPMPLAAATPAAPDAANSPADTAATPAETPATEAAAAPDTPAPPTTPEGSGEAPAAAEPAPAETPSAETPTPGTQ